MPTLTPRHLLCAASCCLWLLTAPAASADPSANPSADPAATSGDAADADAGSGRGFALHAGIRGGASALWASTASVIDTDAPLGYGFGLHLAPLWYLTPSVALGPVLSVASLTHETDALATSVHTPAIGAMLRWHLSHAWTLNADLDYAFGKASTGRAGGGFATAQLPPVGGGSDLHGLQVGVELLRRWQVVPDDIALEVGVNLSYQLLFATDLPGTPDLQTLAASLTIKVWRGF